MSLHVSYRGIVLVSVVKQMGVWVCAQISYKSVRRVPCLCGKVHDISQTACALVRVCVSSCTVFLDYISVCVRSSF